MFLEHCIEINSCKRIRGSGATGVSEHEKVFGEMLKGSTKDLLQSVWKMNACVLRLHVCNSTATERFGFILKWYLCLWDCHIQIFSLGLYHLNRWEQDFSYVLTKHLCLFPIQKKWKQDLLKGPVLLPEFPPLICLIPLGNVCTYVRRLWHLKPEVTSGGNHNQLMDIRLINSIKHNLSVHNVVDINTSHKAEWLTVLRSRTSSGLPTRVLPLTSIIGDASPAIKWIELGNF